MGARRIVALAAAALVLLLLSGCDVAGSLVTKAGLDLGLQELTSELEEIRSVAAVMPTATLTGDYDYTVDLHVEVDDVVESDVQRIVAKVTETFEEAPFAGIKALSFDLSASDGSRFTPYYPISIPPDELASEIHYWLEMVAAFGGPLDLGLYQDPEHLDAVSYLRNIASTDYQRPVDWDAVRAVPDTSTALRTWNLDGLSITATWPPDAVLELRDSIASVPLNDEGQLSLDSYASDYTSVSYFSPLLENPEQPIDTAGWPQVIAAVRLIAEADLPLVVFSYYGLDNLTSTVHLGVCEPEPPSAPADVAMWEALSTSNIALPAGSGPGLCLPFYAEPIATTSQ